MRVRRLVMLRHGQTNYNAGSRMQGQLESELTDLGRAQAGRVAPVHAVAGDAVIGLQHDLQELDRFDARLRVGDRALLERNPTELGIDRADLHR